MGVAHARPSLPAHTGVDREIGTQFYIVLNKELDTLHPWVEFGCVACRPAICLPKEEIRIGNAAESIAGACVGIHAVEVYVSGIDIAPERGIDLLVKELTPKVEDMLALDHRDHVGGFHHDLVLNGIGSRRQFVDPSINCEIWK